MDTWLLILGLVFLIHRSKAGYGEPPRIVTGKLLSRIEARIGDDKKLPCPVEAADFTPEWSKDGEVVNESWGKRFRLGSHGLKIKGIIEDDAGVYVCKAVNGFGSVTINVSLVVIHDDMNSDDYEYVPPEGNMFPPLDPMPAGDPGAESKPQFTEKSKRRVSKIMHPVGNTVTLKCTARGNPPPNIVWLKDSKIINVQSDDVHNGKWTLKLKNLQKQDSGTYMCKVTNAHGSINATYTLEVIENSEKPILTGDDPVNTTVPYGGTASFQCRVRSTAIPVVHWLKELNPNEEVNSTIQVGDLQLRVLNTKPAHRLEDKGPYLIKLVIKNVTEKDSGMYICFGANANGFSFKEAYLTVERHGNAYRNEQLTLALIVGVPIGIILLLILLVVITCRYRSRSSQPATRSTTVPRHRNVAPPAHTKSNSTGIHERGYYSEVPQTHQAVPSSKMYHNLSQQGHHQHYYPRVPSHMYYSDQPVSTNVYEQPPPGHHFHTDYSC